MMGKLFPIILLTMLIAAEPAVGAPLCRDNRGLFTPCTPQELARVRQRKAEAVAKKEKIAEKQRQEEIAHPERPRKPPRPPLFSVGRLCRDSKGLATPCPK